MSKVIRLVVALMIGVWWNLASAQSPTVPIRLVVPFPAGSGTDILARTIAPQVSQRLGQPIIVDNKAGANGSIAGREVARAVPDGQTLLLGTSAPMSTVPVLMRNPPYDVLRDFTPIADIGRYSLFLVIDSSLPPKNLQELVAYVKKHPGKLNYGTGNTAGIVSFAQIIALSGIEIVHVPYKGEQAAMADLIGGRVQMLFANLPAALPHIQSGRVRAIAVTLDQRSPALPHVPTVAESGFSQFSLVSWAGLFGPANMDHALVQRLNSAFTAVLSDETTKKALSGQGFTVRTSSPEKLQQLVAEQLTEYRRNLANAGIHENE